MNNAKGFTLIELMIVVVIVAILAAVAIPSYQNSIQKTRRSDAKEALTRIAAMQERYFFTNNSYGKLTDLGLGGALVKSQEGFYDITLVGENVTDCDGGTSGRPCFVLQADAKGAQANDTTCGSFFINQTGQRWARESGSAAGDPHTTDECW